MLEDAGRGVVAGEQDVGEGLVVPQKHVKARAQALDQIGFQQQRLGLGAGDDELHRRRLAHHAADAVGVAAPQRVVVDALFQVARLADIEHVAGGVDHAVDAGRVGQALHRGLDHLDAGVARSFAIAAGPVDRLQRFFGHGLLERRRPLPPRPRGPACSRQCRRRRDGAPDAASCRSVALIAAHPSSAMSVVMRSRANVFSAAELLGDAVVRGYTGSCGCLSSRNHVSHGAAAASW